MMSTMHRISTDEDALIAILTRSHADVMAGKTYSQEEAERFIEYIKNTYLSDLTMIERMGYNNC